MNTLLQKQKPLLKKLVCVLIVLCMLIGFLPLTAIEVNAAGVTIGYLGETPRSGNGWVWDGAGTLKLYGADIKASGYRKVAVDFTQYEGDVTIDMIGYNKLTLTDVADGFKNNSGNITVKGTGILDISAPDDGTAFSAPEKNINLNVAYIKSDSGLTLAEAKNISVESCYIEAINAALSASDTYSQKKCYVNVKELTTTVSTNFNGGYLESYAIHSSTSTSFSNCVVKVTSTDYEDIQLGNSINLTDSVFIISQYAEQLPITSPFKKTIDSNGDDPSSTSSPDAGWVYCTEAIFDGSAIDGSTLPKSGVYYYNAAKTATVTGTLTGGNYFECSGKDAVNIGATVADGATVVGVSELGGGIISSASDGAIWPEATLIGISKTGTLNTDCYGVFLRHKTYATIIGVNNSVFNESWDTESRYSGVYNDSGALSSTVIGVAREGYGVYGFGTEQVDGAKITGFSATNKAVVLERDGQLAVQNVDISAFTDSDNPAVSFSSNTGLTFGENFKLGAGNNGTFCSPFSATNSSFNSYNISCNEAFGGEFFDSYMQSLPLQNKTGIYINGSGSDMYIRTVYIGDAITKFTVDTFNFSESKDYEICNNKGSTVTISGTCTKAVESIDVYFCDEDGNRIDTPEGLGISVNTNDCKLNATITMKSNSIPVDTVYYLKLVANGVESQITKLTVKQVDYCLDFTKGANAWQYNGTSFNGTNANTTGDDFEWYGTAADGYDAKTLVLNNLQFKTTAKMAVNLPEGTTVILKGADNSIEGKCIAMSFSGTGGKIISGQTQKPSLTLSNTNPDKNIDAALYSEGNLEISDCIINTTSADALEYSVDQNQPTYSYAISAKNLTLNNVDLTAVSNKACTTTQSNMTGASRAIFTSGTLKIMGDSTLNVKSDGGTPIEANVLSSAKATEYTNGKISVAQYNAITGSALLEQTDASNYLVIKTSKLHFTEAVLKTDDVIEKDAAFTFNLNDYIDGGKAPYSFAVENPPSWMTCENGVITGTPTEVSDVVVANITVTDKMDDNTKNSFTIGAVVEFYEITVDCGANGTVTPSTTKKYAPNSSVEFTVTPDTNYEVATVTLDGANVTFTNGKYTISDITTAHTFAVTFKAKQNDSNPPSDGGASSSGSSPEVTTTPENNVTEEKIKEAAEAKDGDKLGLDLSKNENKVIDKEIINNIKGKDVDVVISVGDGTEWIINGKDIPEDWDPKDIDLKVTTSDTDTKIPVTVIDELGEEEVIFAELSFNGEFGFKMTLKLNIGEKHSGKYANLYYYNDNGELELLCSVKIEPDGTVKLPFTHASSYVIQLTNEPATSSTEVPEKTEDNTVDVTHDNNGENPPTGVSLTMMSFASLVSLATAGIVSKKRRK